MTRESIRLISGKTWLQGAALALAVAPIWTVRAETPEAPEPPAVPLAAPAEIRRPAVTAPNFFEVLQQQVEKLFEKCRGAVVRIEGSDAHGTLSGTGFFIDPNGTLYTSYAVGGDTHDLVVIMGDHRYAAKRLLADNLSGMTLLKVEAQTPFLPLGAASNLPVATPVMTIGYPGVSPAPSFGIIGGFERRDLRGYFATTHIRASVPVQNGEGGAPLLNMNGEVIGILISGLNAGGASFVLPVEAAEKLRHDYLRFGDIRPAWLGLSVKTAPEAVDGSTARVEFVFPNTPAQKAGLLPSDVLLQVGKTKITSPEDMLDACFFLSAGDRVTVRAARDRKEISVEVDAADFPGPQAVHQVIGLPLALPPAPPAQDKLRLDFRTDIKKIEASK